MPGGPIRSLFLAFQVAEPFSEDGLRKLLILSARELTDLVANNQEMQQYLHEPPFTIKNVHLIIYNDSNDMEEFEPLISIAELDKGEIVFHTTD